MFWELKIIRNTIPASRKEVIGLLAWTENENPPVVSEVIGLIQDRTPRPVSYDPEPIVRVVGNPISDEDFAIPQWFREGLKLWIVTEGTDSDPK